MKQLEIITNDSGDVYFMETLQGYSLYIGKECYSYGIKKSKIDLLKKKKLITEDTFERIKRNKNNVTDFLDYLVQEKDEVLVIEKAQPIIQKEEVKEKKKLFSFLGKFLKKKSKEEKKLFQYEYRGIFQTRKYSAMEFLNKEVKVLLENGKINSDAIQKIYKEVDSISSDIELDKQYSFLVLLSSLGEKENFGACEELHQKVLEKMLGIIDGVLFDDGDIVSFISKDDNKERVGRLTLFIENEKLSSEIYIIEEGQIKGRVTEFNITGLEFHNSSKTIKHIYSGEPVFRVGKGKNKIGTSSISDGKLFFKLDKTGETTQLTNEKVGINSVKVNGKSIGIMFSNGLSTKMKVYKIKEANSI